MSRYIDAENLQKDVENTYLEGDTPLSYRASPEGDTLIGKFQVIDLISDQPTADVAPVVHAHWIYKFQDSQCYYVYECSSCKRFERLQFTDDLKTMPYCHCGAKMDEEMEEDNYED